MTAGAYCL